MSYSGRIKIIGLPRKRCSKCRQMMLLKEFTWKDKEHTKRDHRCSPCKAKYLREYRAAHPEKWENWKDKSSLEVRRLRNRKTRLKMDYGLTWKDYEEMVEEQGGMCALCLKNPVNTMIRGRKDPSRTTVDHDHITGKVRGLLCVGCNLMLGYAHDDPAILGRAIDYLKKHTE